VPLLITSLYSTDLVLYRLDLSSDVGVLLVRQAEEQLKICEGLADCLEDNREPCKVKHSPNQLISQRVYQFDRTHRSLPTFFPVASRF
jgi:hypothetical protein